MSIATDKFKKNTLVLYDPKDADNSMTFKFGNKRVMAEFVKTKWPIQFDTRFDLTEPTYPITDVAKAIYDLRDDVTAETAARVIAVQNAQDKADANEQKIASESARAIAAESENAGNIQIESGRAKSAEAGLSSALGALQARVDENEEKANTAITNEATARDTEDVRLKGLIDGLQSSLSATEAELAGDIKEEQDRAEAKESALQAQIDKNLGDTTARIDDLDTHVQHLIDSTTEETLESLREIADQLEGADNQLEAAITNALAVAEKKRAQFEKAVRDLLKRVAYLEGVIIETFDEDRTNDNDTSLIVAATISNYANGNQSGYYTQKQGLSLDSGDIVQSTTNATKWYLRVDNRYSIIYSEKTSGWVLLYANASTIKGETAEIFDFQGGSRAEYPDGNEGFGVYIEARNVPPEEDDSQAGGDNDNESDQQES